MISKDEYKIDLDELISEFVQTMAGDDKDSDVKRVKIIKALDECGCCGPKCNQDE